MRRKMLKMAIIGALGAILPVAASANLVINGDFEAGNTGFISGYSYAPPASMYDPATYTVGTDPNLVHSAWTYGPHADHTFAGQNGVGHMMIVNGDQIPNVTVWQGTLTTPLIQGQKYEFSAWVANIYVVSPAILEFNVGNTSLGSITPQNLGTWEHFSKTFTAGANQTTALINQNTAYSGNDFALDDISISAVPEPTTMIAGALLLLPFGASTLRVLRKHRTA
jgi:hypothetical protein